MEAFGSEICLVAAVPLDTEEEEIQYGVLLVAKIPVSYTHLDVYKRQVS